MAENNAMINIIRLQALHCLHSCYKLLSYSESKNYFKEIKSCNFVSLFLFISVVTMIGVDNIGLQ